MLLQEPVQIQRVGRRPAEAMGVCSDDDGTVTMINYLQGFCRTAAA